ncbi:MAG TPA: cellulase, partial [Acidobacteriota bacterium]|nr:cellulase [Acidobacteriota bacterium]
MNAETYTWRNVAIGGGGFVTGVEFHPTERGLAYARTDVGGAYRWDAAAQTWVPLLDWLGPAEWNLQGVESIALDPTDPNRVYFAVGTYTRPDVSNAELLRSTDRGATWQRTPLPFKLGANEAARGSGERLMVDPNSPNILYLGTRRDGLWRSDDHAVTWSRVASFPDLPDGSVGQPATKDGRYNYLAQPVGVAWVRIDASTGTRGQPTPVLYAAISRTGESLFRSTDAGATWNALPQQPTNFRPTGAALAPDGTLYVTYADEPGPNRMRDGAVWKFSPRDGTWTEITPEKPDPAIAERRFGYGAVEVDPSDANTILVNTWGRDKFGEEMFRSTDGGRTWRPTLHNAQWDHSSAPYTRTMWRHWMSDVEVDPFNREHIIFNTGYGLWMSTNATAADRGERVHWVFHNRGLEETVPLALISPPAGAHLLSGLGDIDGFVHDDFTVSPVNGRYSGPGYKNTEWLDYAALAPLTIVRSGTTYEDNKILAAISDDGGRTWAALASQPPHRHPRLRFTEGPVAISADGKTITWTPRSGPPFFT